MNLMTWVIIPIGFVVLVAAGALYITRIPKI
jgi:hypothetical protein